MALVFADRYRDAAGAFDRGRLWLEVVAGILTEAPKEHVRMTVQDLRYALRRLRTSPGFAATSIATLALAIGASTAMFSVLNAVLLRPLPFAAPDRLAMLWTEIPSRGLTAGRSAYGSVEQWRKQSGSFADIAVFDPVSAMLTRGGEREQISVNRVSPNFFPLLGVQPARGRTFSLQEANDRQRLAVISHRFWQARFGGSPAAIGASLELDGLTIGDCRHPAGLHAIGVRRRRVGAPHALCGLGDAPHPAWRRPMVRPGAAAAARDVRTGAGRDERDRPAPR